MLARNNSPRAGVLSRSTVAGVPFGSGPSFGPLEAYRTATSAAAATLSSPDLEVGERLAGLPDGPLHHLTPVECLVRDRTVDRAVLGVAFVGVDVCRHSTTPPSRRPLPHPRDGHYLAFETASAVTPIGPSESGSSAESDGGTFSYTTARTASVGGTVAISSGSWLHCSS